MHWIFKQSIKLILVMCYWQIKFDWHQLQTQRSQFKPVQTNPSVVGSPLVIASIHPSITPLSRISRVFQMSFSTATSHDLGLKVLTFVPTTNQAVTDWSSQQNQVICKRLKLISEVAKPDTVLTTTVTWDPVHEYQKQGRWSRGNVGSSSLMLSTHQVKM